MNKLKKIWNYILSSNFFRVMHFISRSATLALVITLVIFFIEWQRSEEQDRETQHNFDTTLSQLSHIQQSLSTRFLGIFPNYLGDICSLFYDIEQGDSVIIFEDVLYYGIKSRPEEFRRYNHQLLKHALSGGRVLVAFYDYQADSTMGKPVWETVFHKMIVESRIDAKYIPQMAEERRAQMRSRMNERRLEIENIRKGIGNVKRANRVVRWAESVSRDSALCEKYFVLSKRDNPERYRKDIERYLDTALVAMVGKGRAGDTVVSIVDEMCLRLDSVKQACINKPLSQVTFADYERMYKGFSKVIAEIYVRCGIELLPMNDYMTMSCWLVKPSRQNYQRPSEAILAFPSKYSTDEIGFYSQDEAFSNYITTMQQGVKNDRVSTHMH